MSEDYFKIIITCAFFGGMFVWGAIRNQKRVRNIQDTPKSKIASAPQGFIEVEGFAWPMDGSHMSSSGHELVYYKFSLQKEETRGTGKNKKRVWVTVFSTGFIKPFYVLDPTGLAIVEPSAGELEIEEGKARLWTGLSQTDKNFFLENVIPMTVPSFPPKTGFFSILSSKYRVLESEIRSGCPLYVTGDFKTHNSETKKITSAGLTHFANRIIDFNSRSFKNLSALLDKDSDGKICHKEAKDGYSFAAQLSKKKSAIDKITETEFEVFGVMATSQNHKLFLADVHENHLVDKLKRGHYFKLLGGSAMLSVAIVMTLRLFISDAAIEHSVKVETVAQKESEAKRIQKEKTMFVNEMHAACVAGQAAACVRLVEMKDEYGLDSKYVTYYKQSACKNGLSSFCDKPVAAAPADTRMPASVTNTANP